jgi:hypothetical protein
MTKERPKTSEPCHVFLDKLFNLYHRVEHFRGEEAENNLLKKYDYFIRHSDKGRACTYAMKCKQLILAAEFKDLKGLIEELVYAVREMGEEDFAK